MRDKDNETYIYFSIIFISLKCFDSWSGLAKELSEND